MRILLLMIGLSAIFGVASCKSGSSDSNRVSAERAGEKVDRAFDEAGRSIDHALDKAGKKTNDALDKAGNKIEDATGK